VGLESTNGLVAGALAGDAPARNALLERLRPRLVLWVAARMSPALRATLDAEDIVQEILLAVHRDLPGFRGTPGASFGAWLFRLAENRVRDAADRAGAAKRRAVPLPAGAVTTPGAAASRSESLERLRAAVEALPEDHREVVRLRRLEERDDAEVAAAMGRTENAVRILYCRALKALRASAAGRIP
jgi:RNA polymerase sigma-70 factor (ECF subfamily)